MVVVVIAAQHIGLLCTSQSALLRPRMIAACLTVATSSYTQPPCTKLRWQTNTCVPISSTGYEHSLSVPAE